MSKGGITRPRAYWLAAAALLGAGALLVARTHGAPSAPEPDAGVSPLARACPLLRDAPEPPPSPSIARTSAPGDEGECAAAAALARATLARKDPSEAELVALRTSVEAAMKAGSTCGPTLVAELAATADCGLAFDAVAIRVFAAKGADPLFVAREIARPGACQWKAISALRESERVEPAVAAAVLRLTASAADDVRGTAWLTLGTLERVARRAKQPELVGCVDALLATALEGARGDARATLVSSAGNAGCDACRPVLHDVIEHGTDVRLRRSAVTALRFSTRAEDVDTMCRVARTDPEPATRAAAAFALRHEVSAAEARAKCLFGAATEDDADAVRRDAMASLVELAEKDSLFVGVLVQVVVHARHEPTRQEAAQALRAFASDEAIRDALREAHESP